MESTRKGGPFEMPGRPIELKVTLTRDKNVGTSLGKSL